MDIVVPLFSAVGTMTSSDVLETPLATILEYVHSTVGTSHMSLGSYSAEDVARMLAGQVKSQHGERKDLRVRLGAEIVSIQSRQKHGECGRDQREYCVRLRDGDELRVDKLVVATPATSAIALLEMIGKDGLPKADRDRKDVLTTALRQVEYRVRRLLYFS